MNMTDRLENISLLRAIAIILVVLGHATRDMYHPNAHMYSPGVTPLLEMLIKKYIYSFHIPLFFWISGYVHYYSTIEHASKRGVLESIKKKIRRLIIPYYTTSFFVLLPTIYLFGHPHGTLTVMIRSYLLGNHTDHLWFLLTLFIFFLIFIPLQKVIYRTPWVVIVTILLVLSFYRKDFHPYCRAPLYYAIFFYLGYASRKYQSFLDALRNVPLFICFLMLHVVCFYGSFNPGLSEHFLLKYLTSFCGIYYMYFLSVVAVTAAKKRYWKYIVAIDQASLVIYLFHVSVLYCILFICANVPDSSALYRVIMAFSFGLIVPYAVYRSLSNSVVFRFLFGIPNPMR